MRVALEIKHGIDDVLERAARPAPPPWSRGRPGSRDPGRFGQPGELRRAFAHLRHRSRRRAELVGPQVWIESITATCGFSACSVARIFSRLISPAVAGLRSAPAARAQRHLLAGLLAADVERRPAADSASACSSSVLFADPGSPPISTTPPPTSRRRARGRTADAGGIRSASRVSISDSSVRRRRRGDWKRRWLPPQPFPRRFRPACSRRCRSGALPCHFGRWRRIRCRCRSFCVHCFFRRYFRALRHRHGGASAQNSS